MKEKTLSIKRFIETNGLSKSHIAESIGMANSTFKLKLSSDVYRFKPSEMIRLENYLRKLSEGLRLVSEIKTEYTVA